MEQGIIIYKTWNHYLQKEDKNSCCHWKLCRLKNRPSPWTLCTMNELNPAVLMTGKAQALLAIIMLLQRCAGGCAAKRKREDTHAGRHASTTVSIPSNRQVAEFARRMMVCHHLRMLSPPPSPPPLVSLISKKSTMKKNTLFLQWRVVNEIGREKTC